MNPWKYPTVDVIVSYVDERKQLKVNVSPAAKEAVERFAAQYDMTETGVASRVYEWFGSLPLSAQKYITGLVDGSEGSVVEAYRQAFEPPKLPGLADRRAGGRTFREAAKPRPEKGK